jgi:hypothetical protein
MTVFLLNLKLKNLLVPYVVFMDCNVIQHKINLIKNIKTTLSG